MSPCLKTCLLAVAAFALALSGTTAQQRYSSEQLAEQRKLFRQAEAQLAAGEYSAADGTARKLLRVRPTDPYVRRLILRIQTEKRAAARRSPWEAAMRELVVPQVSIDEASMEEVAAYIKMKAEKLSGGKVAPAFVFKEEAIRDRTVTMQLKNVPLSEVLRYAGDLADVRFSYERYAIVGHDKRAGSEVVRRPDDEPSPSPTPEPSPKPAPEEPADPDGRPAVLGLQSPVGYSPDNSGSWR